MTHSERIAITHDSLRLTEAPYIKHYPDGRFRKWRVVGFTGSVLPGPGFNFAVLRRVRRAVVQALRPGHPIPYKK